MPEADDSKAATEAMLRLRGIEITEEERRISDELVRQANEDIEAELKAEAIAQRQAPTPAPDDRTEVAKAIYLIAQEDSAASAARKRAYRGNMLKKLRKVFKNFKPFTAESAAMFTGLDLDELRDYLNSESQLEASRISSMGNGIEFFINSPFI